MTIARIIQGVNFFKFKTRLHTAINSPPAIHKSQPFFAVLFLTEYDLEFYLPESMCTPGCLEERCSGPFLHVSTVNILSFFAAFKASTQPPNN